MATKTEETAKSKLELAKEAQVEVKETMNQKRIEFLELLQEFKGIGGTDDIEEAVLIITQRFKEVPLGFLQTVSPEVFLTKALKNLTAAGKIKREGKKGNYTFKLVEAK